MTCFGVDLHKLINNSIKFLIMRMKSASTQLANLNKKDTKQKNNR